MSDRAFVHETAIVEPGACLGDGTQVWHHAHIRAGAIVGQGCTIGKNVYIDGGAVLGDRSKLQNNITIPSGVRLGEEVFVGPGVAFTNDRFPRAIGPWVPVPTTVRKGASIGANAVVVCGVEIGRYAMVAAGAVVTRDVVDHELVAGNPAKRIGWVCVCGQVLARTTEVRPAARCETCGTELAGAPP